MDLVMVALEANFAQILPLVEIICLVFDARRTANRVRAELARIAFEARRKIDHFADHREVHPFGASNIAQNSRASIDSKSQLHEWIVLLFESSVDRFDFA